MTRRQELVEDLAIAKSDVTDITAQIERLKKQRDVRLNEMKLLTAQLIACDHQISLSSQVRVPSAFVVLVLVVCLFVLLLVLQAAVVACWSACLAGKSQWLLVLLAN